jgi:hypothetical protein
MSTTAAHNANDQQVRPLPRSRGRLQFSLRALLGLVLVVALLFAGGRAYLCWKYPYGWSHCCDRCLMFALHDYAQDHNGCYPAGEETPEASLSLLYPKYADAELLRGKTVPLEVVAPILESGKRLSAETCGCHYVDGLTINDDGAALFWDKAGLDHNGGRRSSPGHDVYFVPHGFEFIPDAQWDEFLEEQRMLLARRAAPPPALSGTTRATTAPTVEARIDESH